MPKLSGNKGEWSEIYVFLRLLAMGKLYAADADLNKKYDVFYNILKIIREEGCGKLEFRVNNINQTINIVKSDTEELIKELPLDKFKQVADDLYQKIVCANSSAFSIETTENFLNEINVSKLKAKSTDKSDIKIKIHDINTGYSTVQGFSIKSRLGSASTLINAGKTTNFIYEIEGNINDDIMSEFNAYKKFKDRFAVLNSNNCDIHFIAMENNVFESNLLLIDGDLPTICAEMLRLYYACGVINIEDAIETISTENPCKYNLQAGHPFYRYKFKKLLTECALGMLPSKVWDGTADATGGYIIVKEDGEVLCYHLFNRNEFEEYLVKNTKFETGSTKRHCFGDVYKENGKYYVKLNLQVRFIK